MDYHPLTKQITDLLTKNNYWFETFQHEPVLTSEEAAKTILSKTQPHCVLTVMPGLETIEQNVKKLPI